MKITAYNLIFFDMGILTFGMRYSHIFAMKKDPAQFVVDLLGGPTIVGRLVNRDVSSVFRWRLSKKKKGAEGRIPLGNLFVIWRELIKSEVSISLEQVVFTEAEQNQISQLRAQMSQEPDSPSSRKFDENCGVDS
ncbi:hypothetical protein [Roseibium album]|uniref:hypothetical protein n=1 Tax=Roseibium album TaxID=311410 RepID=UPI0024922AB6|nr:hypothetical protein [Roseibium album]